MQLLQHLATFISEILNKMSGARMGIDILERFSLHQNINTTSRASDTSFSYQCEQIISTAASNYAQRLKSAAKTAAGGFSWLPFEWGAGKFQAAGSSIGRPGNNPGGQQGAPLPVFLFLFVGVS